jgi:Domain of unknown function DUF29
VTSNVQLIYSPAVNLYDQDFYAWTQGQAQLLRDSAWEQLDIHNLAEEIEALGRRERQELVSRLGVLLGHLLKWEFQPENQTKSWLATIREQRRKIQKLLEDNPSLKPYLSQACNDAYEDGLDLVIRETPLEYQNLPQICPYEIDQVLADSFLPGQGLDV